ncbi:hypothetical protein ACLQ2Q_21790 [Microbacterium sp. DT81.1]|uniref:hypothetical protein n=1 Tax=Microbacterium sp. DT81.1 TaxID=3393413 RepID=UPI003CEA79BD
MSKDAVRPTDASDARGPLPEPTDKVDPAALGLAGVAAAVTFTAGPGDWGILSLVIGLALTFVLLGYHQATPRRAVNIRVVVRRLAFASFLALSIELCVAWPLQSWVIQPMDPSLVSGTDEHVAAGRTTEVLACAWFPLTVALAMLERPLVRLLDLRVWPNRQITRRKRDAI